MDRERIRSIVALLAGVQALVFAGIFAYAFSLGEAGLELPSWVLVLDGIQWLLFLAGLVLLFFGGSALADTRNAPRAKAAERFRQWRDTQAFYEGGIGEYPVWRSRFMTRKHRDPNLTERIEGFWLVHGSSNQKEWAKAVLDGWWLSGGDWSQKLVTGDTAYVPIGLTRHAAPPRVRLGRRGGRRVRRERYWRKLGGRRGRRFR